jgi:cell division protein FtsI (penicillin-binding protein 3)
VSPALRRRRLLVVLVVTLAVLGAVLARVVQLQTTEGESLRQAGAAMWTRDTTIKAQRGTIFDRNGDELAISVPTTTVTANPKQVDDPAGTAALLAQVLGLGADRHAELAAALADQTRGFLYVQRQVDDEVAAQVVALDLPGISTYREDRRMLPGGDVGRSVIGRTDVDGIGYSGLELQYDDLLSGIDGASTRQVAQDGASIPGSESVLEQPVPGDDLVLTLDRSIQFATEQALLAQVSQLGARGATAVIMDVRTGEMYAMASVRRGDDGAVAVTSANYAAVDAYEPGSVVKVITLAAALNEGVVSPGTTFVVPWRKKYADDMLEDAEQHPDEPMSVLDILVKSSNIGTITVQQQMDRKTHWEYLRSFGLGERTALDFPGESAGILKSWDDLWGSERVTVAYGQGISSSTIQLVAAINTIANGGTYVSPRLVRGTVGPDGELTEVAPSPSHQVVTPEVAATVTSMMREVVCRGTGKQAQLDDFTVAGKTGTGLKAQERGYEDEQGNRVYYASFAGFFPAEAPRVTVLISVDEPPAGTNQRFGGTAAAPVFQAIAPTIVHELGIQPVEGSTGCPG